MKKNEPIHISVGLNNEGISPVLTFYANDNKVGSIVVNISSIETSYIANIDINEDVFETGKIRGDYLTAMFHAFFLYGPRVNVPMRYLDLVTMYTERDVSVVYDTEIPIEIWTPGDLIVAGTLTPQPIGSVSYTKYDSRLINFQIYFNPCMDPFLEKSLDRTIIMKKVIDRYWFRYGEDIIYSCEVELRDREFIKYLTGLGFVPKMRLVNLSRKPCLRLVKADR